jgi:hypothetical protein
MPRFLCVLVPRPDAKPAELKKLGKAIVKWSLKEEVGIQVLFDPKPVQDLLNGELPPRWPPLVELRLVLGGDGPPEVRQADLLDGGPLLRPGQLQQLLAGPRIGKKEGSFPGGRGAPSGLPAPASFAVEREAA